MIEEYCKKGPLLKLLFYNILLSSDRIDQAMLRGKNRLFLFNTDLHTMDFFTGKTVISLFIIQ